ncbi:hypothetical protein AB0H34_37700 [Saccharopolyspora shandongensis]|uniref:hypothetical protein n=1 Tax=Saccharopolyspora shandongensis TaxID=418495 RepID=UPI0033EF84D8
MTADEQASNVSIRLERNCMMVNGRILVKKFAIGAVLGLSVLAATATPAAAEGWNYTGHWYYTEAQCEKAWEDMTGGGPSLPHECRHNNGVYELWAYSL